MSLCCLRVRTGGCNTFVLSKDGKWRGYSWFEMVVQKLQAACHLLIHIMETPYFLVFVHKSRSKGQSAQLHRVPPDKLTPTASDGHIHAHAYNFLRHIHTNTSTHTCSPWHYTHCLNPIYNVLNSYTTLTNHNGSQIITLTPLLWVRYYSKCLTCSTSLESHNTTMKQIQIIPILLGKNTHKKL